MLQILFLSSSLYIFRTCHGFFFFADEDQFWWLHVGPQFKDRQYVVETNAIETGVMAPKRRWGRNGHIPTDPESKSRDELGPTATDMLLAMSSETRLRTWASRR
jgi:hypothetical protein